MAFVALSAIPFLYRVENKAVKKEVSKQSRSLLVLLKQHSFITAVSSGVVAYGLMGLWAYGLMSFVMTATPISMHEHFSHSLSDTKWVIQSHIMAMFLPSLFSAWIVQQFGIRMMMWAGLLVFAVALVIAFIGQGLMHFWFALVFLGLGWNLLFIAGTVLLPSTHNDQEKYTAQGFNDSVVFGAQALVALSSGLLLSLLGWHLMLLCCVPLILWQAVLLLKSNKTEMVLR
jgi:MFS family permease